MHCCDETRIALVTYFRRTSFLLQKDYTDDSYYRRYRNIGTELVKSLVTKRTPIRVITRDEKKIAHLGPEVGRVIGDRHEPSVVQRAPRDVEKVFVLSGPFDIDHEADRLLMNKAKNAGVRQIVLVSSNAVHLAEKNSVGVFHREKEMLVEESGIPWTFFATRRVHVKCFAMGR